MITLSRQEVELVLATLALPSELRRRLEVGTKARELDGDELDLLVELATDRLMTGGFDAAYRPTVEGAALERLIDRLVTADAES